MDLVSGPRFSCVLRSVVGVNSHIYPVIISLRVPSFWSRVINIRLAFKCRCDSEVHNLLFVFSSVPSAMVVCTNEHSQQQNFSKTE